MATIDVTGTVLLVGLSSYYKSKVGCVKNTTKWKWTPVQRADSHKTIAVVEKGVCKMKIVLVERGRN